MSMESTSESSSFPSNEWSQYTLSLFLDSIHDDAREAFKEHLHKYPVEQRMLNRCLLIGLQSVQKGEQELSQLAPSLQLILEYGAQWTDDGCLENGMTPCHLICKSNGDHHRLLDLMLIVSGRAQIDTEDLDHPTALVYAIQNTNINCVRSLLKNGANVNYSSCWPWINSPLVEAMSILDFDTEHSTMIKANIFDLLLSRGADVNAPCGKDTPPPVLFALNCGNDKCMKKLIQKGARLGRTSYGRNYVWAEIVKKANVDVLKNIIEQGINKDSTDKYGKSMLRLVTQSGNVEAVRYLLDLGVTFPTYQPKTELKPCKKCRTNRLYIVRDHKQTKRDPCMAAISKNALDVFQLLENYSAQSFNSFNVLMQATYNNSPDVMEYLLNKYTYPVNVEYVTNRSNTGITYRIDFRTLLMEACYSNSVDAAKMLLDHGADSNKWMCEEKCFSVINIAIYQCNVKMVAHLIRSGLNISSSSYHFRHGYVLPFEAAILDGNFHAATMLLVSGCSCGVYSLNRNHEPKAYTKRDLKNIMKEWNVDLNNVNPLEQQCRRVILNHLSPRAHKKIRQQFY